MSTFSTTLTSLAALGGAAPEPPPIDPLTHRCSQCDERAYRRPDAAYCAADEMGCHNVFGCGHSGCGHTVLTETPEESAPPRNKKRLSAICATTGKQRYASREIALSTLVELNNLSRREHSGRLKKRGLSNAYRCQSCGGWHLTTSTS